MEAAINIAIIASLVSIAFAAGQFIRWVLREKTELSLIRQARLNRLNKPALATQKEELREVAAKEDTASYSEEFSEQAGGGDAEVEFRKELARIRFRDLEWEFDLPSNARKREKSRSCH